MSLYAFVAGRYAGNYNSVDVGITTNGYELQQDSKAELINQSDQYGDSIIDIVYRGGDVYLQFESKVYMPGSISPFWPYGPFGQMQSYALATPSAPVGRLGSGSGSSMVLTAEQGSPANPAGAGNPLTLTGASSVLAPNTPQRLLFTTKLRVVPIRLLLLPTETGANPTVTRWFSLT